MMIAFDSVAPTDGSTSNNVTVDTLNSSCSCADSIYNGTSSGHLLTSGSADRYLQVQFYYTHNLLLNFDIYPVPDQWIMTSTAKFPVARYNTTFGNTSSCS